MLQDKCTRVDDLELDSLVFLNNVKSESSLEMQWGFILDSSFVYLFYDDTVIALENAMYFFLRQKQQYILNWRILNWPQTP